MKIKMLSLYIIIQVSFLSSCKKEIYDTTTGVASINVINTSVNTPAVNVYFTSTPTSFYLYQQPVGYGSSYEWTIPAGNTPVFVNSSFDSTNILFSQNVSCEAGAIYSLYLSGSSVKSGGILMRDTIPSYSDSLAGVRFINMSSDSRSISINIQGNPNNQFEFTGLAYTQISNFKIYSCNAQIASYNFEIRDQATGNLLATYTWNCSVFKNNTIVMCGFESGSGDNAFNVFQVNNF